MINVILQALLKYKLIFLHKYFCLRITINKKKDGKLVIWDGFSTNKEHVVTMPTTWVMTCAYAPSGSFITCGGLDNKITLYKITSDEDMSKQKRVIANHTNYISCNKFMYSDQQVKYKYKKINKLFFNNVFFFIKVVYRKR